MPVRIFLLFIISVANVYAGSIEEQLGRDLSANTVNLFCSDAATIKYLGQNHSECSQFIKNISRDCLMHFSKSLPELNDMDEFRKNEESLYHLSSLYFSCVKSAVFEKKEGVKLLSGGISEAR